MRSIPDPDRRAELVYLFDERAGICQHDGGMSRGEAERIAYRELARAVEGADDEQPDRPDVEAAAAGAG